MNKNYFLFPDFIVSQYHYSCVNTNTAMSSNLNLASNKFNECTQIAKSPTILSTTTISSLAQIISNIGVGHELGEKEGFMPVSSHFYALAK